MAWSTSAPAALAALVAAWRAAPGLAAPVVVHDGPVPTGSAALALVVAGWNGHGNDEASIEGQNTPEGLAGIPDREQYSIRCAVVVFNGSSDIVAARTRAYELFAACGAAVAADRTLGGTVMRAVIGAPSLLQSSDPAYPQGITATVEFMVDCDAFSGR